MLLPTSGRSRVRVLGGRGRGRGGEGKHSRCRAAVAILPRPPSDRTWEGRGATPGAAATAPSHGLLHASPPPRTMAFSAPRRRHNPLASLRPDMGGEGLLPPPPSHRPSPGRSGREGEAGGRRGHYVTMEPSGAAAGRWPGKEERC
jgi:hypothetical protein